MIKQGLFVFLLALSMPFSACSAQAVPGTVSNNPRAETTTALTPEIGGIKQFVEIKTDDASKPILLFLSGGPGSSMIKNADAFTSILKSKFTIVQWDQRDAGKTLQLNPSPVPPSVEQMQDDTLQVIEFLRTQYQQEKIYLLGSSWGNVLGFHVVKTHPEWLHAYFAVNPVVSQLASERELLDTLKNHFRDNAAASKDLSTVDTAFHSDADLFYIRKWLFYKDGMAQATSDEFKTMFMQWSASWSPVWRKVMTLDLRRSLTKVDVPVYLFVGKNDIQTSARITTEYFNELQAPRKDLFLFEKSGHQIHKDEPEKLQQIIIRTAT